MSCIGNSGARSSGPTGWPVPGCSGGGGGAGRSGMTLYHWVGISDSSRVILVRSLTTALLLKIFPAQYRPPSPPALYLPTRLRAPLKAPPSLLAPSSLVSPVGAGALWLAGYAPSARSLLRQSSAPNPGAGPRLSLLQPRRPRPGPSLLQPRRPRPGPSLLQPRRPRPGPSPLQRRCLAPLPSVLRPLRPPASLSIRRGGAC